MALVSIITVNLNNGKGLQKTMDSVFNQTFKDLQYIVIDGGSTDGSQELVAKYKDRIDYYVSEKDNGVYDAMNKAIAQAKGQYLLFLNSGDYLCNEIVLEKFNQLKTDTDIVSGSLVVLSKKDSNIIVKAPDDISFYILFKHSLMHQATFIKRQLFDKYGLYDTDLKILADWEFFVRTIILNGATYKSFDQHVAFFEPYGMSSKAENSQVCLQERKYVLNKDFRVFLADYELLKEQSIYTFLKNINSKPFTQKIVVFLMRVYNKLYSLIS